MNKLDLIGESLPVSPKPLKRYGILVDTNRQSIVVICFDHHQDLLDLILSNSTSHLILYRTQYHLPSDDDLLELSESLWSE